MKPTQPPNSTWMQIVPGFVVLLLLGGSACQMPAAHAQLAEQVSVDLTVGAAQFPDQDAVILRWEQHWTIEKDGTVHRRDHRWVKLFSSRTNRRFADPRIDFVDGKDQVIIHTARTHLPNGQALPVPDYSFNYAAPDDVAGRPLYAKWQQEIISFSGVQDDAVIELDYEVISPPGTYPWIDADLRLHDDYPTVARIVSVTIPEGQKLHYQVDRITGRSATPRQTTVDGATTYRWTFAGLDGTPGEEQSPPWQRRCGRLRFTTASSTSSWVSAMLDRAREAGRPDDRVKRFAELAGEDEVDPEERARKIAGKLRDSFNFITSPKALRSLQCRSADKVLRANYGNPLESAALLLAAFESMGMKGSLAVGVEAGRWSDSDKIPPTRSAFAGVTVTVDTPTGPLQFHPQHGEFSNPGSWGRHILLESDKTGQLHKTYVYARGEKAPSELNVVGKITLADDGNATGELRFRATGMFYDPADLKKAAAQKKLITNWVKRVLTGFEVSGHSVATLSNEVFRATASVRSKGELNSLGDLRQLQLGKGPAFLADIHMPLDRSYRDTDVQLAGRFRDRLELTIELPKKWKPAVLPATVPAIKGRWGSVEQAVNLTDDNIRLSRDITITEETVSPSDFANLRAAINDLRTTRSLLVVFDPSSSKSD